MTYKFTDYLTDFMLHVKQHDTDLDQMGITFATILDAFASDESAVAAFHRLLLRERKEEIEFQLHVTQAFKHTIRNLLRKLGVPIDRLLMRINPDTEYVKLKVSPDVFGKFIIGRNQIGEPNWIKDLHARIIR